MKISKNDYFLKIIAKNDFKCLLLNEFNFKEGGYEGYNFTKPFLNKSKLYQDFIKKNQLDEVNSKDINVFAFKVFFIRFISKSIMSLIGIPVLLTISHILYFKELFRQHDYVKANLKKYMDIIKDLKLTRTGYFIKIFTSPVKYILSFFFGYIFERWGITHFPLLMKMGYFYLIAWIQSIMLFICLILSPLVIVFFVLKFIFKKIFKLFKGNGFKKFLAFFNEKVEVK